MYIYICIYCNEFGNHRFKLVYVRGTNMYIRNKIEYKVAFTLGAMSNAT